MKQLTLNIFNFARVLYYALLSSYTSLPRFLSDERNLSCGADLKGISVKLIFVPYISET